MRPGRGGSVRGASLLPARRLNAWLWLVGWVIIIAASSGLAGRVWSVTQDDTVSWLPRDAESTRVVQLQERFSNGVQQPVIVVYHRGDGLTEADKAGGATADIRSRDEARPERSRRDGAGPRQPKKQAEVRGTSRAAKP